MKFGIATFVTDEGIRPGPLGRALEERGFDSLFVTEHSHIPASRETPYAGGGDLPRVYYRTPVFGARGPESAGRFAEAGVERVMFMLPTMPEAETLAALDRLAAGVDSYR